MKKILTFLTLMLLTLTTLFAQSNDKISYQAVIRNSANQLVVNSEVNVTISVANSQGGSAVYTETHTVTTNENGLMSLLVGEGTLVSGSWSDIDWSSAYVTSTMTVDGETLTHTVPVNAVPYALYADQVDPEQVSNIVTEILPNALENYVTNDQLENYVTDDDLEEAIDGIEFPQADWNAEQGPGVILNKPTIPTSVSDLEGADDLVTDDDLEALQNQLEETLANYATEEALADTAASLRSAIPAAANAGVVTLWQGTPNNPLGSFNVNTADNVSIEIPAQVQADWEETDAESKAYINNKPSIVTPEDLGNALEELQETLEGIYATKEELLADSNALANQITDLGTSIINAIHDTADVLRSEMPDAQVQADWTETNTDSKAFILNKPTIPEAANEGTVTLWQGTENNVLGSFDVNTAENVSIEIPTTDSKITTAKINEFLDNVDIDTAMTVLPHVQGMPSNVKEGLKTWVALVAKNNPTYVMDILTHYIENLTPAQVSEIFGSYDEMNAQAKSDFRDNMLEILDIPTPEPQVQADWNETDADSKAFIQNKPTIPEAANEGTVTLWQGTENNVLGSFDVNTAENVSIEIPTTDSKITTAKINEFIDAVTMDTALAVLPHVQGMPSNVKEGLKAWVAQVVKNNPTHAMDVLTYYIENLTPAQVSQIFGAYDDMTSTQAKEDLLNGLAQIIKDNPDIAYDVLNYYIDHVTVQQALPVYQHIHNNMNPDVKEGLKLFVAQTVKNNPNYVMDVLTHYIENLTPAQVSDIFGAYDEMNAQAKSDFRDNMLEILDIPTPEAQVQADWAETNTDSKAFILNKPTIPEAANNATLTLKQGETTLGTFTADASQDVEIEIPTTDSKITTAKINEFIDAVTMDTAMAVLPHVQGMDNTVKAGLKAWVAQVVKNNPTHAMDVLTYYIENLTPAQVSEIFGAYDDMASTEAKEDLLNGLAQIVKDNPDIAYDVLNYYIDHVTVQQALPVYQHIHNNMNADVKEGLKLFVAQTVKNNPSYVMDVLTHYIENLTQAQVSEIFGAYDNMNADAKSDFRENLLEILDIPAADSKITTAKINEFLGNVTLDTAMTVFPYVQGMDNTVKEGLKAWVTQVVNNNPTYAMQVLTHYIKNLTPSQVGEIFGAYNDMTNTQAKTDLLNGLAQIIKDNPDIAYDVLIDYIDNVTVQQALPVYQHIHNNMNADVKEGLKMFVAQTVINNPNYILQVLKAYLETPNATTKEEVVTQYAIAHRDVAKAIMVDYLANGTTQEMMDLLTAFMSNTEAFNTFKTLLDAHIDSRIAAATETSMKFTATDGQTSFTLNHTPKANYVVRLYINGVMVGDSATGVVTVNGTTVTYVPGQNDNYNLKAGDKVILSFFY